MVLATFVESLGTVSTVVGLIVALGALLVSAREYRLKARSQRAEIQINLAKLFADLVPIANGRDRSTVSEAAVNAIARANSNLTAPHAFDAAVITPPVGEATQAAAIASIGQLGGAYKELRAPAQEALETLAFVDVSDHLRRVRIAALRACVRR